VVKLYEKKKRFLKKFLAHFSDIFYFNLYDSNNVFLNIGFEKIILHSCYNSETFVPNPCFLHTLLKPLLESFLNLKSYYENP